MLILYIYSFQSIYGTLNKSFGESFSQWGWGCRNEEVIGFKNELFFFRYLNTIPGS